jgi:acyl-CoA hydrolase
MPSEGEFFKSGPSGQSTSTEVRLVEIVFPDHCNHLGTLFGGQALAWMDKAAFLAASRHAGCTVVTARSDRIDFTAPVRLGEIVEVWHACMRSDAARSRCGFRCSVNPFPAASRSRRHPANSS